MGTGSNYPAHAAAMAAFAGVAIAAACAVTCCPTPALAAPPSAACNSTNKNFSNQVLSWCNFSGHDLTNANFTGATLTGVVFIRATLTGANFTNATFADSNNPVLPTDFTLADLTNTIFRQAKFNGLTYFTYATVTCADFSQTDISNGNPVFGDEPLNYTPGATCPAAPNRVKFQGTKMNCEFINDWHAFDLTGADVKACLAQLAGRNFSDAMLGSVHLEQAILDGATFTNAQLQQAWLTGASLQCAAAPGVCVDLTNAQLQGANLDKANLTGASLYRAYLSNEGGGAAATLISAHLKNVNLSFAQLSGVDFRNANFYGNFGANSTDNRRRSIGCATTGANHAGFTVDCASAFNANLVGTRFPSAYLYGVDFGNATISGVSFDNAVLVGADFSAATIGVNPSSSASTTFNGTYLQGTNLDSATLSFPDLTNAFVDFRQGGNNIYIYLSGATHNSFACSTPSTCKPASGQDVCVFVQYQVTTVPTSNGKMTCPNGSQGPCGPANPDGSNLQWKSALTIGAPSGPPPGWYADDATYTPKAPNNVICNGKGPNDRTIFW